MLEGRIYDARRYKEKKQKELADLTGLSQSRISAYERGIRNPKPETLQRIAQALNLTILSHAGFAYFYDPYFDESMPEDEIAKREAFNSLQENDAIQDAEYAGFATPYDFEKAWYAAGGGKHSGRTADLARIDVNKDKLNDLGVEKLADHSDLLLKDKRYRK